MVAPINPKAALYFGGRRGGRLTEVEMSLTSLVDRAPTFMAPREPAYSTTHEYSTVLYCTVEGARGTEEADRGEPPVDAANSEPEPDGVGRARTERSPRTSAIDALRTSARALALRLTADGRDAGDDEEGGVDDGTPRRSAEASGLEISSSSAAARLASRIAIARARADMRWLQRADKEKPKWCSRSKYCTRGGV